jgi:hypothetical protein
LSAARAVGSSGNHQAPLQPAGLSSSLPPGCREPFGLLPTIQWLPGDCLSLPDELGPLLPGESIDFLAGRPCHTRA